MKRRTQPHSRREPATRHARQRSAARAGPPPLPPRRGLPTVALLVTLAAGMGCRGEPAAVLGVAGLPHEGLVFVHVDAEGRRDLWRARLSDGAVRPFIVTPDREEAWPYWSQAARMLVFEVFPKGARDRRLRLWRAADDAELAIPGPGNVTGESWAAWGPQGEQLAYVLKTRDTSGLAVLDLPTWESTLWAVNRSGVRFFRPDFSSDGQRLIAQGREKRQSRIYLLAPGRLPSPLTPAGLFAYRAGLTRDGRWCLFTDRGHAKAPSRIATVRVDGSGLRELARRPDTHNERATASPARDELAFVSDREGQLDVFVMDFPDGEPRNVTRSFDLDAGPVVWSPDGEKLAVVMAPSSGGRSMSEATSDPSEWLVVVIDRDGRELFRSPGMAMDWMPAWP